MKKFLIGCGVVLAAFLLLTVGVGVFAVRWVQKAMPDTDVLTRYERELEQRYGEARAWTPPLDGAYDPQRLSIYTDLRERLVAAGGEVARGFDATLDGSRSDHRGIRGWIHGTQHVIGLLSDSLEYVTLADSLLLDAGMGKGEYTHYNVLVVHGLLGLDVQTAIDELDAAIREDDRDGHKAVLDLLREYQTEARQIMRAQIGHALDALDGTDAAADTVADGASSRWRDLLDAALGTREGFALTDPLPEGFVRAVEPLRMRLTATRPNTTGQLLREAALILDIESDEDGVRFQYEF